MKYLAVCVLSILTMLTASASPSVQLFPTELIAPAVHVASELRGTVEEVVVGAPDAMLMVLLGGALVALQLRRRQKSLRSPRFTIVGN